MEYIYAAMLLHKSGKAVNEASVKKVLEAAGVAPDETKLKALVASLDGVDIDAVVKEAAIAPVAVAPAQGEKKEDKKEEKEDKKEEVDASAGLGALFG